jgi:hypothetical protein
MPSVCLKKEEKRKGKKRIEEKVRGRKKEREEGRKYGDTFSEAQRPFIGT